MNPDTQPSPYAEFLEELHQQPLEDGPTIRLEVEPDYYHPRFARWIEFGILPLLGDNRSEWSLLSTSHGSAVDPVDGGPCFLVRGHYQSKDDDEFETVLTVLLVPIPHSAH